MKIVLNGIAQFSCDDSLYRVSVEYTVLLIMNSFFDIGEVIMTVVRT